jgi:demethylmenaquinone methyltransferase/2-methoxy-6-polyprenyl-1,4-benzoquinol methylase
MKSDSNRVQTNTDKTMPQTHFGYETIDLGDKQGRVNDVFDKVAERYDLMNDLMSGGLHRAWKSVMVEWLAPPRSARDFHMIDVAGGTGDIAFRTLERAGTGAHVTVCDINHSMVGVGARRAQALGLSEQTDFTVGNAESLGFPDQKFDAYTIAFGIRNVPRMEQALEEAYRVLKLGGRFMCLEFSTVNMPGLDALYDAFSFQAIPLMGQMVTGDGDPYRYLVESIRKFPSPERFQSMIERAGFERVSYRPLSGGIAAIHSGWRL